MEFSEGGFRPPLREAREHGALALVRTFTHQAVMCGDYSTMAPVFNMEPPNMITITLVVKVDPSSPVKSSRPPLRRVVVKIGPEFQEYWI
jgi:hypothetical protein